MVDLFPHSCEGCAAELPRLVDAHPHRYQQLDLREHRPHVTETRRHAVDCPDCGACTRAPYDPSQIPASPFGPRLVAVVGLLTGVYHLSRRRTQRLLHDLFGISVSLVALSAMEHRASEALATSYEEAQREVDYATVKHADATTWLNGGKTRSLWTIACLTATVFKILLDGSRDRARPFFGPLFGILVSDRAAVFTFWKMGARQICWAHLIRKFIAFSERDGPAGRIGRELLGYSRLVFEYWHGFRQGELTRDELQSWLRPVQAALEDALARAAAAGIRRLSRSCKDILAHREAMWRFAHHPGVEPTNNHAERELRAFVLWRKAGFGCQSERGERFAERMMSVAYTARKQGVGVLDFVTRCLRAHLDGQTPPRLIGATSEG